MTRNKPIAARLLRNWVILMDHTDMGWLECAVWAWRQRDFDTPGNREDRT